MTITRKQAETLNQYTPKGCPFDNYTLLDLLSDLYIMHDWRVRKDITAEDFIKFLQDNGEPYALAYGNAIISILRMEELR